MLSSFTVTATHPTTSAQRVLNWQNEDFVFIKARPDNFLFYRNDLDTTILLCDEDFTWMYALYLSSVTRCEKVNVKIEYGATTVYEGYISLKNCKWYPSRRQAECPVRTVDGATPLIENWEKKINVLTGTPTSSCVIDATFTPFNTASNLQPGGAVAGSVPSGTIVDVNDPVATVVTLTNGAPGLAPQMIGNLTRFIVTNINDNGTTVTYDVNFGITLRNGTPSLSVPTRFSPTTSTFGSFTTGSTIDYKWQPIGQGEAGTEWELVTNIFDAARDHEDILNKLTNEFSYQSRSDFFGYNAPGGAPSNSAYSAAGNLGVLKIFQKSDVLRPLSDANATRLEISLKDMANQEAALFNVYPTVELDGTTYFIRWEHISYFYPTGSYSLDLTGRTETLELDEFEEENEDIPRFVSFSFAQGESDDAFAGDLFTYSPACSGEQMSEQDITADKVDTDVSAMILTADSFADSGMCIMSTTAPTGNNVSFTIDYSEVVDAIAVGSLGTSFVNNKQLNGKMSWPTLQRNYHTYQAYENSFLIGDTTATAASVKPSRKLQQLEVTNFSLSDWLAFDASLLVKTDLADCRVQRAEWSAKTNSLKLDLVF